MTEEAVHAVTHENIWSQDNMYSNVKKCMQVFRYFKNKKHAKCNSHPHRRSEKLVIFIYLFIFSI